MPDQNETDANEPALPSIAERKADRKPTIVIRWRDRFGAIAAAKPRPKAPAPVEAIRIPTTMSDDELIEFEMHPEARGDFKIRPISREWRYLGRKPAYRTAVCNVAYISRDSSAIDVFGKMPRSFSQRGYELRGCGLMLPGSAPQWAREGYRIWEEADANTAATCDPRDASAWHVCGQIPGSLPADLWSWFVTIFVERELTNKGAAVAWAIHGLQGDDGEWIVRPHFHLIVSRLYWRHRAKKFGTRHPAWLANRKAQARLAGAWHRWCGTSHLWRRLKGEHAKRWTGE